MIPQALRDLRTHSLRCWLYEMHCRKGHDEFIQLRLSSEKALIRRHQEAIEECQQIVKVIEDFQAQWTPEMIDWEKLHRDLVGRKFRRRKDGHQETRLVTDTTLGCQVVYRYGPHLQWGKAVGYVEWDDWQSEAKEIEQ